MSTELSTLGSVIKTAYEGEADTNAFTDAEKAAVATNSAKVTNATHSGDAVGDGALTLQPAAITGKGAVTVAGSDLLLVADVSASPQVLGQVTAQSVADLFDASGYLPLSGGQLTGSVTFAAASPEHTVDGRNLSVDGAKLDGIEASADVTDTANVTAAGALMDSEVTNLAAVKAFDPTDYATAAQGSTADTAMQPGDDAADLGSAAATDGYVLTADGAGGAAWEAGGGAVDWTSAQNHDLTAATGDEVAFSFTSTVNKATSGNYTGIKLNVTETSAPGATDSLMDLQVGSSSRFRVANDGAVHTPSALYLDTNQLIAWEGATAASIKANSSYLLFFKDAAGTTQAFRSNLLNGDFELRINGGCFKFFNGSFLCEDAANNLAQRNSTNAQTFRVYGTYTDASNLERIALSVAGGVAMETAGTGADDIDLPLTPAGAGVVKFGTHSAIAAETVTGYITIKTADGTTRKLAVVS